MKTTYSTAALIEGQTVEIEFTTYYDDSLDTITVTGIEGGDDYDLLAFVARRQTGKIRDAIKAACRAELRRLREEALEYSYC